MSFNQVTSSTELHSDDDIKIGQLAKLSDASIRSLRYYEEQKLLHPKRTNKGYRIFNKSDVADVYKIQALLAAGISTAKIRQILPCVSQQTPTLKIACSELRNELIEERDELRKRIALLVSSLATIDQAIEASEEQGYQN